MKEFIKIGDYYVKDAQAREDVQALSEEVKELEGSLGNLPSGGDLLPTVSTEDNGKVLQVVGGKWAKATLSTTPSNPSNPAVNTEEWQFVLDDGTVVKKDVCVG